MEIPQIDRRSAIPIYFQLKEAIYKKIKSGEWQRGQQIPSLRKISDELKISLMTARQAIKSLVDEKVLSMHHGQGTFILGPGLREDATIISSFSAEMLRQGYKPSSKILKKETVKVPEIVSEALGLNSTERVHYISRLRYADGIPVALQHAYLPANLFPDLLERDFQQSLVSILANDYHHQFNHGTQTIRAKIVDKKEAGLLCIPLNAPVLCIERTSLSQSRQPIEFLRSVHRADKYAMKVNLRSLGRK